MLRLAAYGMEKQAILYKNITLGVLLMNISVLSSHWFPQDADQRTNPTCYLFVTVPGSEYLLGKYTLITFLRDCTPENLEGHYVIAEDYNDGMSQVLSQPLSADIEVHIVEYRKPMTQVLETETINSTTLLEHLHTVCDSYKGRMGRNFSLLTGEDKEMHEKQHGITPGSR